MCVSLSSLPLSIFFFSFYSPSLYFSSSLWSEVLLYIHLYIIFIKSRCLLGFPWLSLFIRPYHPSLPDVFQTTSCVRTKLSQVSSCKSANTGTSMWWTLLLSSSLLFQQYHAYLVPLTWVVLEMGDKWPYNCCFREYCFQDLFKIGRSIVEQFLSSFFSIRFVSIHVVHPYISIDTTAAGEKSRFILSYRIDQTSRWSIAIHAFTKCIFSWRDAAAEVRELVNWFQKTVI